MFAFTKFNFRDMQKRKKCMEGISFCADNIMLSIILKQEDHEKGKKFCFPFEDEVKNNVYAFTEFKNRGSSRLESLIKSIEKQGRKEVYQGMMEIRIDESRNKNTRGILRKGLEMLRDRNESYLKNLDKRFAEHIREQDPIKDCLDKIKKELETYRSQVAKYDCFQRSFCFFAESREINRDINHSLAQELFCKVGMAQSLGVLDALFEEKNVADMRNEIAKRSQHKRDYVSRGINSKGLNKAIKEARKIIIEKKDEEAAAPTTTHGGYQQI